MLTSRDQEIVSWLERMGAAQVGQVAKRFGLGRTVSYRRLAACLEGGPLAHDRTLHGEPGLAYATRSGLNGSGLDELPVWQPWRESSFTPSRDQRPDLNVVLQIGGARDLLIAEIPRPGPGQHVAGHELLPQQLAARTLVDRAARMGRSRLSTCYPTSGRPSTASPASSRSRGPSGADSRKGTYAGSMARPLRPAAQGNTDDSRPGEGDRPWRGGARRMTFDQHDVVPVPQPVPNPAKPQETQST